MLRAELEMKLRNGAFAHLKWQSKLETYKQHKDLNVVKIVESVVRVGCDYYNTQYAKDRNGVAEGGKANFIGGAYESVVEGMFTYHPTTNKTCLKLWHTNNPNHQTISKYYINGVETTKEYLLENGIIKSKYAQPSTHEGMFKVDINNILEIL